jgi:hypothetical protein
MFLLHLLRENLSLNQIARHLWRTAEALAAHLFKSWPQAPGNSDDFVIQ